MKNKPHRHKESNTFKFQPFSERIANIDVDIFHRVGHRFEEASEDSNTFFYQALQKWNILNMSENYHALRKEIGFDIQTLPQLLAQKERIVSVLLKYLSEANVLSLQATLEFVVALARDLRQEFYPHYVDFHVQLLLLLNTKNTDQLEWVFTCLAYLFKFLWRFLIRDLTSVFESLLPLLSNLKPRYINNFAAESFAFITRKVKDKRNFIKLILRSLQKNNEGISGCGQLLFETMHGLSGQFHTCAESLLTFLLQSLSDEGLPQKLLFQVLAVTVKSIAENIQPVHSGVFWKVMQEIIQENLSVWKKNKDDQNGQSLCHLLKLIVISLQQKDATFLHDPKSFTHLIMEVLKADNNLPESSLTVVAKISRIILLSPRVHILQEDATKIIRKVMAIPEKQVLKQFVEETLGYPGFEILILPDLVTLCSKLDTVEALQLLVKLILFKKPPALLYNEFQQWSPYFSDWGSSRNQIIQLFHNNFLSFLDVNSADEIMSNMHHIFCVMLVLPHVFKANDSELDKLKSKLTGILEIVHSVIVTSNEECDSVVKDKFIYLLSVILESVLHLHPGIDAVELYNEELLVNGILPYCRQPCNIIALRLFDLYISTKRHSLEPSFVKEIIKSLVKNLSSPFVQVRMLTAHLLLQLQNSLQDEHEVHELSNVLSVIIAAESEPASIDNYRRKLHHLQLLECRDAFMQELVSETSLRFLISNLYINFQLLWGPVQKLISSYALKLPVKQFWPTFSELLHTAAENCKSSNDDIINGINFDFEPVTELYSRMNGIASKPDYENYRILLWKTMTYFPDICEAKNRDLSPLFLSFMEEEYYKANPDVAAIWNIKSKDCKEKGDKMEIDDENDEDEQIKKILVETSEELLKGKSNKVLNKSLLVHLDVFGLLHNPQNVYREPELMKIYNELLTHKNPDVQRAVLKCIMTYKHKYLMPYSDHLYKLIDDKSFKDEVVLFRIDSESNLIRPEHRGDLIPVVMRIVYSKMLNRSGVRTGGKHTGQLRRSVVFRFLMGCHQEELLQYLKMAFRHYQPMIKDDVVLMVDDISATLNLEQMIPPKRLLSAINLLNVIMAQCGSLMGDVSVKFLLQVLLCIGQITAAALSSHDNIHTGYLNLLKNIRNMSIDVAGKFFSCFQSYTWASSEIDATFKAFVWPWLHRLPVEGIHSPTSLMKLFLVWSQHTRYFPLLAKYCGDDQSITPLPYIMELLGNSKSHGSVKNSIIELVERLLTMQEENDVQDDDGVDDDDDIIGKKRLQTVPVTNILPLDDNAIIDKELEEKLSYGCKLVLPHMPVILQYMKQKLSKSKGKRGLSQQELTVLSRATELINDPVNSDTLISLVVPILLKKAGSSEDIVCPLLTTITNLLRNVEKPQKYVRSLAPVFGQISGYAPRKALITLVQSIGSEECVIDGNLLENLNAWDAKWVGQPDFNRRLDAYMEIQKLISYKRITLEMGVIIIYNSFFFIRTEKDMSLCDAAGQCLRKLCPILAQMYDKHSDFVINQTILTVLSAGIRNKNNEVIQQESIAILGCMARECSHLNPVLNDLSLLSSKADLEVDFFENLQHLQLHRKVRALLRFSEITKGLEKPPLARTITQFILPLVSRFLCNEKFVNKNTIIDAAVEALATICQLLPWHHYYTILRYYLGKLRHLFEFQKQLVRVVVAIINSFHFDLSKAVVESKQSSVGIVNGDMSSNVAEENVKKNEEDVVQKGDEIKEETSEYKDADDNEDKSDDDGDDYDELDKELDKASEADEEATEERKDNDHMISLSKSAASRVVHAIRTALLPQLQNTIYMRSESEKFHKVNKKMAGTEQDEEDILRVPIALAAVKLLQRLPELILLQNLNGILMRLCVFLKSRLDSVRRITRETLQNIMVALGTKYLPQLIEVMTALLTRGFHAHVLVFSLHSVLVALKELYQPGHLDACIVPILKVCCLDLFGSVAEEKEVAHIAGKLMEARANKSYDTFLILAQYITDKCLVDLILPLKEELTRSLSHKIVHKVSECLRNVVLGLVDNKFVTVESLMIFAHGITSESIPSLVYVPKKELSEHELQLKERERPDSFLILKEPKRRPQVDGKHFVKTNAHVLVEFGLRLYYFLLKREKVKSEDCRPHLDPLATVLKDCLTSQHVKLTTLALQCLCWILKFELPSLKNSIKEITKNVFAILHKYAAAGLCKGDNFDLVMAAFKVVAVIVRDVKYHVISPDELRTLLLYCEQDIQDFTRQVTAFSLLKAIISRKLVVPELHDVMKKVAEISITSELDHVRLQARQIFQQFLLDYPIGKKLNTHLAFYLSQLSYELQPGRKSAILMTESLVKSLPQSVIQKHSGLFFINLSARLVNDDSPECRMMVANIITQMLEKLPANQNDSLFDIVLLWLKDNKVIHRRLAAQLCGIFATKEKADFERRLHLLLPVVLKQFAEGFVETAPGYRLRTYNESGVTFNDILQDHHLYQVQNMLIKICNACPKFLNDQQYTEQVETLAEKAQELLAHPHEWVRLSACQFLGRVLSVLSPSEVAEIINNCELERPGYLLNNTRYRIRTLTLDLCSQLTPGVEVNDKLLMQAMKNLVFIAEVLKDVKEVPGEQEKQQVSLLWLIRRFRKLINTEVAQAPIHTQVRMMSFNWLAALVVKLDKASLQPILHHILTPIVRELNTVDESNSALQEVAKECANYVRQKIGGDEYNRILSTLTTRLDVKRIERKKERAQLMVKEPEKAAKRKINKQLKKKVLKKRKLDIMKGRRVKPKKAKKVEHFEDT